MLITQDVLRHTTKLKAPPYRNHYILHILSVLNTQDVLRRVNASPEAKTPQGRRVLEAALDVAAALEGRQ
jgi:spore coat protein CotF